MFEKIGRNECCPCGSGLKFKKCCLPKEQYLSSCRTRESSAMQHAMDWLTQNYQIQANNAIENEFFGSIGEADQERLNMVSSQGLQHRIQFNIKDWLINEASLEVEGEIKPAYDLLLNADKKVLSMTELECLKKMRELPLSLYEVQGVKAGEGVELIDLLHKKSKPVWVIDRIASKVLSPSDIFGTRLLGRDHSFAMSGAVYSFSREDALACLEMIFREAAERSVDEFARHMVNRHIIKCWLEGVVSTLPTIEEPPNTKNTKSWLDGVVIKSTLPTIEEPANIQ